jgi:hypothetical protein
MTAKRIHDQAMNIVAAAKALRRGRPYSGARYAAIKAAEHLAMAGAHLTATGAVGHAGDCVSDAEALLSQTEGANG